MLGLTRLYEENEVRDFVNKSTPVENVDFKVLNFKEDAGWVYINCKCGDSDFLIHYSSAVMGLLSLIRFFQRIIKLKDDVVLFLDNEGSDPMLYAKIMDDNKVRFIFAQDYELYKKFVDDEIEDWELEDYKIECDIIVDKKDLIREFYEILKDYNFKAYAESLYIDIKNCKQNLKKIKNFLKKNLKKE